ARNPEALAVIERSALQHSAPLWRIGREFYAERHSYGEGWQRFSVHTPRRAYRDLQIPLAGAFQVENAATAVAALDAVSETWRALPEEAIREGLSQVRIAGRMEVVRRSPTVILDGAHNAASAQALADALQELYGDRRLILVLGVLEGHLAADIVGGLAPRAAMVIATAARDPRAQPAALVAAEARRFSSRVEVVEPVAAALQRAISVAELDDVVCVTGSFTVIGEAGRALV
ncbi:MAG: cyanophycin synthetase, partial [Armatimonadota bacterium]|nr:cyanophycin synthetase [Armatimonadota bacterium]